VHVVNSAADGSADHQVDEETCTWHGL